jgi:hypothetical protein
MPNGGVANLLKIDAHPACGTALLRRLAPFEHLNIARSEAKSRFMREPFGAIFFSAGLSDQFLAEQPDMPHLFFDNGFDAALA